MKRTVITSSGIVPSIGNSQQGVLASLREGHSETTFSQELKGSGMCSHVWGNIKLNTTSFTDHKIVRFMSDASIYVFLSTEQAVIDAGLATENYRNNPRVGLIIDSGGGSPHFQVFGANAMRNLRGLRAVGSYMITKAMVSDTSVCPATPLETHSVNYSISSACAISTYCIGNAVEQTQLDKQDIVFTDGGKGLCWEMACEFDAIDTLSTKYNDNPPKASHTCNAHRGGFTIAGGGSMVVAERLGHALAHNAHIYVKIVSYGATLDGADMAAPSDEGVIHCMQMAIHGIDTPIDYLNSHGTSTPVGNVGELDAIREVFGDSGPAISMTRVMTGHSLGTAGVQETIYPLLMLEHGFVTSSINIEELDEQAAGLDIVIKLIEQALTTVISSSFGFGGTNATLVMRKLQV